MTAEDSWPCSQHAVLSHTNSIHAIPSKSRSCRRFFFRYFHQISPPLVPTQSHVNLDYLTSILILPSNLRQCPLSGSCLSGSCTKASVSFSTALYLPLARKFIIMVVEIAQLIQWLGYVLNDWGIGFDFFHRQQIILLVTVSRHALRPAQLPIAKRRFFS